MLKQHDPTLHKTIHTEITSLFGQTKLILDETPKAVSPFDGLASFISFLGQIGWSGQVQKHLPFAEPTSNNAIPRAHSLTAFMMAVVCGAQRFAHCEWLRADRVLHALLGMGRFPIDDTIRNFFLRFSQAQIETFWRPLWRWLVGLLACPKAGFALDLDSTVFCREGQQAVPAQLIMCSISVNGTGSLPLWRHFRCQRATMLLNISARVKPVIASFW